MTAGKKFGLIQKYISTYISLFSATSNISTAESSKPCIVVEERGTADSYTGTTVPSPSRSKCLIVTLK